VHYAFAYLLLRHLFQLMAGSSDHLNSDLEVVVLRHQLMVLKRKAGRPRLRRRDRLFMAAMSTSLPRARWSSFLVSPQTLLRWHRELVRRKWTFRRPPWSAGHRSPMRFKSSSCGWGGIIPDGDASGSGASSPSSASRSRRPRSARCCGGTDSVRLPADPAPPGASSSGPRPGGSWHSTS
jgi:putative transposase